VLFVGGAMAAGVLAAAVLAGSLSDAMTSRAAAREARQVNESISAQVEAGRREVEFARSAAFLGFTARSFGWGRDKERAFALRPGGPPPPLLQPLGDGQLLAPPRDPLGAVLDLLFER